jgi:uncharacterized protein YoaH (UPF0181 family)
LLRTKKEALYLNDTGGTRAEQEYEAVENIQNPGAAGVSRATAAQSVWATLDARVKALHHPFYR